jgi:hypothetical protein
MYYIVGIYFLSYLIKVSIQGTFFIYYLILRKSEYLTVQLAGFF